MLMKVGERMEHGREHIQDGSIAERMRINAPRSVAARILGIHDLRWQQARADQALHIIEQVRLPCAQCEP